jgi:signal transduction histidine kinase
MEAFARLLSTPERPGSEARPRSWATAVDWFWALVSLGMALFVLASGGLGPAPDGQRDLDALGVVIAVGISMPLLARRRAPLAVFVVMMAALVALTALRYPPDVTVGPWVALFTLARASGGELDARPAAGLAIGAFIGLVVASTAAHDELLVPEMAFTGLLWVAIWLAGRSSRLKAEHIHSLEERAARAEEEARRERRLAAAEERTRIARDLHDTAGHAINVILMQAGAARLLRERDPAGSEVALRTIEDVARGQIGEIDRLVSALRAEDPEEWRSAEDGSRPLPGDIPRGPAAGRALLERMRASGLELSDEWRGQVRRLGPTVGRASYRILQEALTNAARHGTGSASVVIDFGEESVELTVENPVRDDGHHASSRARVEPGNGLTGMRERVSMIGGSLDAGREDGIFRVRARLPYDPEFDAELDCEDHGA